MQPYCVSGTMLGVLKHGPEQRLSFPAKTAPFSLRPALSAQVPAVGKDQCPQVTFSGILWTCWLQY